MKGVGYTDRQARDLLKEVVLVSTGCVSRPSKEKERFSTVYLIASNDRIHRFKNWLWGTIGTALRTIFSDYAWNKHTKSLSIRSLSPSSVFMTAAAGTSFFDFVIDKNTGEKKVKKFMPLYPRWTMRRSYHELQHYVTMDPNNNGFANVVLSTLTNAIGRSETPDALKLIEPPSNGELRSETNNAYKARMKRALEP
jgi:hypothetical protein